MKAHGRQVYGVICLCFCRSKVTLLCLPLFCRFVAFSLALSFVNSDPPVSGSLFGASFTPAYFQPIFLATQVTDVQRTTCSNTPFAQNSLTPSTAYFKRAKHAPRNRATRCQIKAPNTFFPIIPGNHDEPRYAKVYTRPRRVEHSLVVHRLRVSALLLAPAGINTHRQTQLVHQNVFFGGVVFASVPLRTASSLAGRPV